MKVRIWGMIIAGILVLTLATAEAIISKVYLKQINEEATYISSIVDDSNYLNIPIKKLVKDLDESWEHKEKVLCILINHKNIEELGEKIDLIKTAIELEDYDLFKQNLNLIIFYSSAYEHLFGISIENII